jgi:hypothetical protein
VNVFQERQLGIRSAKIFNKFIRDGVVLSQTGSEINTVAPEKNLVVLGIRSFIIASLTGERFHLTISNPSLI